MGSTLMDPKIFAQRVHLLHDHWTKNRTTLYHNADSLVFIHGTNSGSSTQKALFAWLLGRSLTDTMLVFTETTIYALSSSKKAAAMVSMKDGTDLKLKMEVIVRNKKDKDSQNFEDIMEHMKASFDGKSIGRVGMADEEEGNFCTEWGSHVEASNLEAVNVKEALLSLLAVRSESELKCIRTASSISVAVLKNFLVQKIETIIDMEKKVSHSNISRDAQALFESPERISKKLTPLLVSSCYPPIVQSGGKYNLSPGADSDAKFLAFDNVVCSLGARYKNFCSDIARTYFIDPAPALQHDYEALVYAQEKLIEAMKPGVTFSYLYDVAKAALLERNPKLDAKFHSDCGFLIGIDYAQAGNPYVIRSGNLEKISKGMAFTVRLGLNDLSYKKAEGGEERKCAMLIADTVTVGLGSAQVLTAKCTNKFSEISYELGSEESEEENSKKKKKKFEVAETTGFSLRKSDKLDTIKRGGRTLRNTTARSMLSGAANAAEVARKKHQKELAQDQMKKNIKLLKKNQAKGKNDDEDQDVKIKKFKSYKSAKDFPADARPDLISVDAQKESILLPIYGYLVPFHISTVKTVTKKNDDYLSITLKTPTPATADQFEDLAATFVRECTFRIVNQSSLNNTLRRINELKKRVNQREQEVRTKASLTEQPRLILNRSGRHPRLPRLSVRPNFGGKKSSGTLEAHDNGFRFSTLKNGNLDLIYQNIKHAIFQPAEKSLIVLIHFFLHDHILIGKKKTKHVQFYMEVVEASLALGGRSTSRWGDAEEIEDEQREREQINKFNAEFQKFVKVVEESDAVPIEFDIPYRDLGFYGVVGGNSNVFLTPTVNCLAQVTETPFFVMSLEEVQIAYFERVQYGLRNFDLVFIFNDWSNKEVHINGIPINSLESIKEWLNSINIKYYQGKANLRWKGLLETFSKDPISFWEEGGWSRLDDDEEEEEQQEAKPSKKSKKSKAEDVADSDDGDFAPVTGDDNFRPSSSGDESSFQDSEGSGSSDDAMDEDEDEDEDSEDEGMDWDELDEHAEKLDLKKKKRRNEIGSGYDSDDARGPAKRRKK